MNDGVFALLFGIIAGVALVGLIQTFNPDSSVNIVSKAMAQCEKSLPRDQKCVIIAVPPSKD